MGCRNLVTVRIIAPEEMNLGLLRGMPNSNVVVFFATKVPGSFVLFIFLTMSLVTVKLGTSKMTVHVASNDGRV